MKLTQSNPKVSSRGQKRSINKKVTHNYNLIILRKQRKKAKMLF